MNTGNGIKSLPRGSTWSLRELPSKKPAVFATLRWRRQQLAGDLPGGPGQDLPDHTVALNRRGCPGDAATGRRSARSRPPQAPNRPGSVGEWPAASRRSSPPKRRDDQIQAGNLGKFPCVRPLPAERLRMTGKLRRPPTHMTDPENEPATVRTNQSEKHPLPDLACPLSPHDGAPSTGPRSPSR